VLMSGVMTATSTSVATRIGKPRSEGKASEEFAAAGMAISIRFAAIRNSLRSTSRG
jgi:hypothetical protein